jgi:hypothetical protein
LGRAKGGLFRAGMRSSGGGRCSTDPNEQAPTPVHASSLYRATRQGWAPPWPATIMATADALPRLLMASISPGKTWLPLNVTIVANGRGDTPSSYRARALGTGHQEMSRGTACECMPGASLWPGRALERQCITRACCAGGLGSRRERPALHLRGSPRRPRVALRAESG